MIDVPYAVKRALKDGNRPKQYRFQVLNDDETVDFTIDNDTLVKESVKIDERMCSGDRLKFGLCEGSSLEFQYFNHPNIRGRRVKVYLDVAYDNEGTEAYYPLSMGYFDVDQCSTQFSTGIIKAVGYNKLRSDYLDEKCNDAIIEAATTGDIGQDGKTSIGSFLYNAMNGYSIEPEYDRYDLSCNPSCGADSSTFGPETLYRKVGDNQYEIVDVIIGGVPQVGVWRALAISSNMAFLRDNHAFFPDEKYWRLSANCKRFVDFVKKWFERSEVKDYYVQVSGEYRSMRDVVFNSSRFQLGGFGCAYESYTDTSFVNFADHENDESANGLYIYGSSDSLLYKMGKFVLRSYFCLAGQNESVAEVNARFANVISEITSDFVNEFTVTVPSTVTKINAIIGEVRNDTAMEGLTFTTAQAEALPDVTLRELQSAVYETSALYGQLDRDTDLFYGVELNSGSLTPSASLYPSATLYPNQGYGNNIFRPFPSEYQKLWTDSVGEQTFRYLIITYKAIEYDQQGKPTEVDKTLQRTVHEHGTTNYNCSDNWLFRNLVWTAEQVGAYADAMVEKMLNIRWFPFEMWSTGLPYVEVGDAIEIADKEGDTHISYVLQRQLNGIQNLQDTYINGQLDIF